MGFIKQAAFNEQSEFREDFIRSREAWKDSLAEFVASDRLHLAVVVGVKGFAASLWGLDMEDLKARHGRFMESMRIRARCYGLTVKDSFEHLFSDDPWGQDSSMDEEPLLPDSAASDNATDETGSPAEESAFVPQADSTAVEITERLVAPLQADWKGT